MSLAFEIVKDIFALFGLLCFALITAAWLLGRKGHNVAPGY